MRDARLRCPIDSAHGPLLDWPNARYGFHCHHTAHGGNGLFLTTDQAEGLAPVAPTPARELLASSRVDAGAPGAGLTGG